MICRKKVSLVFLLAVALWESGVCAQAQDSLVITEFMAANDRTVADDLGDFSDWIEIFNNGATTVNLGGYYLTDAQDDLTKWRFPATNLPPQRYLLVYASGRDRNTPGKPLHTNFKLSAEGEYLALVKPDGVTAASELAPAFPPQQEGLSYGIAAEDIKTVPLIAPGTEARVLIPTNSINAAWIQLGFDDASWSAVKTAIKYDLLSGALGYGNIAGTDIQTQMQGRNATAYIRIQFAGTDFSKVNDLQLLMRYDDGFVAYLNGQEVARRLAPAALQWNSAAVNQHSNALALVRERINLLGRLELLRATDNVLAIHGLNRTAGDGDFLMLPEIVAREVKVMTNVQRYFSTPTPGGANIAGLPGAAGEVRFSRSSTTFVGPFPLELRPAESTPAAVIRYTLDRKIPTESSPIYSAPLSVTNSVQVRARVFAPGLFPGPVKSASFVALSSNVVNFTSDLPILVIHSLGGGRINGATYNAAFMTIHEPVRGRSSLTNAPHASTRAGFKDRGSSTAGQAKANYAVEIWDEDNRNTDFSILGMPADSEWVFHAPYSWDPSLIRNPLAFEFGWRTGRYASRYRFVEVYVNGVSTNGPISSANYAGVYNILEQVKRGKDRIDIDELLPGDLQAPEVTGGYIMKIDRTDPSDTGLTLGGRSVAMVEPREAEIKAADRAPQRTYLTGYMNAFNAALNGANSAHPTLGYAPYIDASSWIDFHIADILTWNVDALRLSSYFYKPRNGPLVYGPLWDYDRSLASTDSRDDNPRIWGDTFFTEVWWNRLFRDPNFWQRWIDRWQEVREGNYSNASLLALVDSLAAQVQEAAPRDFAKWRQPKRGATQQGEISFLKNWLTNRLDFMDTNLLAKPIFSRAGGQLHPGFSLTMTGPEGATVFYTLDGSDPRLPGGQVAPSALTYNAPAALANAVTVNARSRNLNHRNLTGGNNPPVVSPWSGLTQARFSAYPPVVAGKLLVTEIHHNPAGPSPRELAVNAAFQDDDFEFIELKNTSADTLDLYGAVFRRGIEFAFTGSAFESLGPGNYLVIAKNRAAFAARYGKRPQVAGEFKGSLDNNGERLELTDADGMPVFEFEYRDAWFPITDGHGFSLVLADEAKAPERWGQKLVWRPSAQVHGSPGLLDPVPGALPGVVINEVLAYSDRKDAIELLNPTRSSANIGGWFLTDDLRTPKKFRIPDGATIPAGGFRVFDEDDFNSSADRSASFSFSRFGEQIYLFSADSAGNLQWHLHGSSFDGAEKEVTFGRYLAGTGEEQFVAQSSPTINSANSGPRVGPVVINEIMYHPPEVFLNGKHWDNDEDEFIELHNITTEPVPLFDPAHPANAWSLRGAVDFDFPTNRVAPARGFLLVVGFDPMANPLQAASFRTRLGIDSSVPILGPYTGKLDNGAGSLRLFKPGEPENANPAGASEVPRILTDAVDYGDDLPWSLAADGLGHSLQRAPSAQYGNEPMNWNGAPPTPGAANQIAPPPVITHQPESQIVVAGASATLNVTATGAGPLAYRWRFQGQNLPGATHATLTLSNVKIGDAGEYQAVVLNDGSSATSAPAKLTVLAPATIVVQPAGRNVNPGGAVTLAVSAKGTGPLTYQWRFNGMDIPGATSASLRMTNMQLAQSGPYAVVVNDRIGSSLSQPALVNVLVKPEITTEPQGQIVLVGDRVLLNVAASGTQPLSYRWRRDGVNIPNATNSTLVLSNVQLADSATYTAIVTNIASARLATVSQDAVITVLADFDKDRMADFWEAANGFATNNAADALFDADGDGLSNQQEYLTGTNPRDDTDLFKIEGVRASVDFAEIQFQARSNKTYTVQFKDSVGPAGWVNLTNVFSRATNRMETVVDRAPRVRERFYRLVTPALALP